MQLAKLAEAAPPPPALVDVAPCAPPPPHRAPPLLVQPGISRPGPRSLPELLQRALAPGPLPMASIDEEPAASGPEWI